MHIQSLDVLTIITSSTIKRIVRDTTEQLPLQKSKTLHHQLLPIFSPTSLDAESEPYLDTPSQSPLSALAPSKHA